MPNNNQFTNDLDTGFMLAMRHRQPVITLEEAIKTYLPHMNIETAKSRAAVQTLPFPAFKVDGKKSPYMVKIAHLAAWLDQCSETAEADWGKMNS